MRKRIVWILVAVAAAGLIGYSVYRRMSAKVVDTGAGAAVPVSVVQPRRGEIERTLSYAGTLSPSSQVTLTPKIAGRIERILAKEGDAVRQDELLVLIEGEAASLQATQAASALEAARAQREKARKGVRPEELASAQASLAQAEKDLAAAEESHRRADRLYKEGTIAKAAFEEAERRFRAASTQLANARRSVQMMEQGASAEDQGMAEANVKALQAQYDLAKLQAGYTRVLSPIAGRVAKVLIDEGNMASQSTPLLVVVRDEQMTIRIPLPEKLYGEFRERRDAMKTRVMPSALPGTAPLAGRISSISPTIDPASRTFTAEITLANEDGRLRAGMYANVDFVMERMPDALLVPLSAVVVRGEKRGVFIVGHGTSEGASEAPAVARFLELRLGLQDASSAQVLEGLQGSESVVAEGNAFLEDGQAISTER
jgi:RND family efflux transporter MFP subunit